MVHGIGSSVDLDVLACIFICICTPIFLCTNYYCSLSKRLFVCNPKLIYFNYLNKFICVSNDKITMFLISMVYEVALQL